MTLLPFTEEKARFAVALSMYKTETANLRHTLDGFLLTESEGKKCSKRRLLNEETSSLAHQTGPPPTPNPSEND